MTRVFRPVRRWKVFAVLFGIPPLLSLAFWLWARSVVERRWAATEGQVLSLLEQVKSRDSRRPVLLGEPAPGNAWDEYAAAMRTTSDPSSRRLFQAFLLSEPVADRGAVRRALTNHAEALDYLRRGARCDEARGLFLEWGPFGTLKRAPLDGALGLTYLAGSAARILGEHGRHGDALDMLLELAQFGRDGLAVNSLSSVTVGLSALDLAFDEMGELFRAGQIGPGDLQRVTRALGKLDESWPQVDLVLPAEVAAAGKALPDADLREALAELRGEGIHVETKGTPGWRHLWSERLMKADAFSNAMGWLHQARGSGEKTWAQENRAWESIGLQVRNYLERTGNSALIYMGHFPHGPHKNVRERRAQLRILRELVRYVETGVVIDLADPFGDRLRHDRAGGKLRVWSVGWNGVDDGGIGSWSVHSMQDIVLELDR